MQLGVGITGPGGLRHDGAGQLVLQAAGNYSGGTTVTSGTVVASSPTALPSGSSFDIGSGGTLVLMGGNVPALLTSAASAATVAASPTPWYSTPGYAFLGPRLKPPPPRCRAAVKTIDWWLAHWPRASVRPTVTTALPGHLR